MASGQPRAASGRAAECCLALLGPRDQEWFRPKSPAPVFNTKADFRGQNDTYFVMLSAPGMHFGARTMVTDFRLPTVQLVHGTFFTDAVWVVRGLSKRLYAIVSSASKIGFDVLDANQPTTVVAQRKGVWQTWKEDGILAFYKQQTIYVRANGWEARAAPAAPRRWPSPPSYTEPLYAPGLSTP